MTDEQIIAMLIERNENAISELDSKYHSYCQTISYGILKNHEDTEECYNDMLHSVWQSIPPNHPDNLKAYCARVIRNISLNRLQSNNAQKRGGASNAESLDELDFKITSNYTVEDEILCSQTREIINEFLISLPRAKRVIFVRKYWYCDSIEEIANRMKMTPSNVKITLFRLRDRLKKKLQKGGLDIE